MTHPATIIWHGQRAKCMKCRHRTGALPAMRCKATPDAAGARVLAYCIDARDSGPCGPKAKLFEAAP